MADFSDRNGKKLMQILINESVPTGNKDLQTIICKPFSFPCYYLVHPSLSLSTMILFILSFVLCYPGFPPEDIYDICT
jgi:hypothetical protein